MTGQRLLAVALLVSLAGCAFWAVHLVRDRGIAWANNLSNLWSFALALLVVLIPIVIRIVGWLRGRLPLSATTLADAQEDLANVLIRQWAEEDRLRQLNDPWPLPVRWETLNGARGADGARRGDADGAFADIHAVFLAVPGQRLVIIGPAGAGKSALAIKLIRDLLAAREPGDPVPVLLPAGSWTVDSTLGDWVGEQLVRTHPGLAVRIRSAAGGTLPLTRALVEGGILPIVDGLDELPEARRAAAITEINAFGSDQPVVLTSRPEEYAGAIASRPLAQSVVVGLQPLRIAEIKTYAREATSGPNERWDPVFAHLDAEPDGALAKVLSTPLMVWLARTVYDEADPCALADRDRLPDADSIEAHLLAEFVPAVYRARPRKSGQKEFRCKPEKARKWLGFLAAQLNREDAPDIAWWRLQLTEPAWAMVTGAIRSAIYVGVTWWLTVWVLTERGYMRNGEYIGDGHYLDLFFAGPLGEQVRPLFNDMFKDVSDPPIEEADTLLRSLADLGLQPWLALALMTGAMTGIVWNEATPRTLRFTWKLLRRRIWTLSLALFGLLMAYQGYADDPEPIAALLSQHGTQIVLLWLFVTWLLNSLMALETPIDVASAAGPRKLLRQDRNVFLLSSLLSLGAAGLTWLWAGPVLAAAQLGIELTSIAVASLLGDTAGVWPQYRDARLRLAVRGRLPWRSFAFLDDAHRRGVLRQTGAVYQFRHIRLQKTLATGYSAWPPRLAPAVAWSVKASNELFLHALNEASEWTRRITARHTAGDWARRPIITATIDDGTRYRAEGVVRTQGVRATLGLRQAYQGALSGLGSLATTIGFAVASWRGYGPAWFFAVVAVIVVIAGAPTLARAGDALWRRHNGRSVAPVSWSVRVSPDSLEITTADETTRLTPEDIAELDIRPVNNSARLPTPWSAVQVKPRPGVQSPTSIRQGWVPFYWLPYDDMKDLPPALIRALDRFAGRRFSRDLAQTKQLMDAREHGLFEAGGIGRLTTVLETIQGPLWLLIANTVFLVVSLMAGWSTLGVFLSLGIMGLLFVCIDQLDRRAAEMRIPGRWIVRVTPERIMLTVDDQAVELRPSDIKQIAVQNVGIHKDFKLSRYVLSAELSSGIVQPLPTSDGWLTFYWTDKFSSTVPRALVEVLNQIEGIQLKEGLKRP